MKQYYSQLDVQAMNDIEKIIQYIPAIKNTERLNDIKVDVVSLFYLSYKHSVDGQVFGFSLQESETTLYLSLNQLLIMCALDLGYAYQHKESEQLLVAYNMYYSIWNMKASYHVDLNPDDIIN